VFSVFHLIFIMGECRIVVLRQIMSVQRYHRNNMFHSMKR